MFAFHVYMLQHNQKITHNKYISKRFEFEHRRNKDSAINNLHRYELN